MLINDRVLIITRLGGAMDLGDDYGVHNNDHGQGYSPTGGAIVERDGGLIHANAQFLYYMRACTF